MKSARESARRRVAHVLPWPSVGGTEVATLRMVEVGRERGFDAIAYVRDDGPEVQDFFRASGVPTASYTAVEPSYRSPRAYLRTSSAFAREFRRRHVDIVHCADILAAYLMGLAARLAGLPLLCHVRNRYPALSRRDRSFLFLVNRFVFVSWHTWQSFALRVPRWRGTVLYDGIDVAVSPRVTDTDREAVRRDFRLEERTPLVGMVARLAPQKDFRTLVEAAEIVLRVHPEARFMIVGDHDQLAVHREHHARVLEAIRSRGLDSHFIFTGYRRDVERFLKAFDCVVLSTHREGLPLVLLEAMAQGLPVVATAVDGVAEVVRDGETGFLVPHQDAAALADRLCFLLSNPTLCQQMGRFGMEHVRRNFSRKAFGHGVGSLYSAHLQAAAQRLPFVELLG